MNISLISSFLRYFETISYAKVSKSSMFCVFIIEVNPFIYIYIYIYIYMRMYLCIFYILLIIGTYLQKWLPACKRQIQRIFSQESDCIPRKMLMNLVLKNDAALIELMASNRQEAVDYFSVYGHIYVLRGLSEFSLA